MSWARARPSRTFVRLALVSNACRPAAPTLARQPEVSSAAESEVSSATESDVSSAAESEVSGAAESEVSSAAESRYQAPQSSPSDATARPRDRQREQHGPQALREHARAAQRGEAARAARDAEHLSGMATQAEVDAYIGGKYGELLDKERPGS